MALMPSEHILNRMEKTILKYSSSNVRPREKINQVLLNKNYLLHSRYKINMASQDQQMFINYITRLPLLKHRWLTWNHLLSKLIMLHLHRLLQPLVLLQRPKMQPAKHL
jgi:hypothetical protein